LWASKAEDVIKFLNTLDKKMIMVSGGEPLLYDWGKIIKETNHYWCFATNTSVIPQFLSDSEVKQKVKLFLSAFHREGIGVGNFITNAKKLQDMGYAVFSKIIYVKDNDQFYDCDYISSEEIPVSFSPLVGVKYSKKEIDKVLPYCISNLYKSRFLGFYRQPRICVAGTKESFQVSGTGIVRCGLQDIPFADNLVPIQFLKRFIHDDIKNTAVKTLHKVLGRQNPYLGTIYEPRFNTEPLICHRRTCECEWHTFSEMGIDLDNNKWQRLIETGKWN
jgi:hypothetical protein